MLPIDAVIYSSYSSSRPADNPCLAAGQVCGRDLMGGRSAEEGRMPQDSMASTDAVRRQAAAAADDAFGADRLPAARRRRAATRCSRPPALAAALQMALCGARGATAAQLAAALHLDGPARGRGRPAPAVRPAVLRPEAGPGGPGGGLTVRRPEHPVGAGRSARLAGLHRPARGTPRGSPSARRTSRARPLEARAQDQRPDRGADR